MSFLNPNTSCVGVVNNLSLGSTDNHYTNIVMADHFNAKCLYNVIAKHPV